MAYKLKQLFFSPSITFVVLISLVDNSQSQQIDFMKTYAVSGFSSYCYDMTITHDNKFLLTGADWIFHGDELCYLLKTDSLGNKIWSKVDSTGGDEGVFVKELEDRNYIVGAIRYNSDNSSYITKYDTAGNSIWQKYIGISGESIIIRTVVEINKNLYFIGQRFFGNDYKGFILKTNASGDSISSLSDTSFYPGGSSTAALIYDSEKIIITGSKYYNASMTNDPQLTVIDTNFNIIWQETYPTGTNLGGQSLCQVPGGYVFTSMGFGSADHIHKVDSVGSLISTQPIGAPFPNAICYINPSTTLVASGWIYLLWMDQMNIGFDDGNVQMPNGGYVYRTFFKNGKVIISGSLTTGSSPVTGEAFLVQLSDSNTTNSIAEYSLNEFMTLSPNSCKACKQLTLTCNENINSEINIFDTTGKHISKTYAYKKNEFEYVISLKDVSASGYYYLAIDNGKKVVVLRFYFTY